MQAAASFLSTMRPTSTGFFNSRHHPARPEYDFRDVIACAERHVDVEPFPSSPSPRQGLRGPKPTSVQRSRPNGRPPRQTPKKFIAPPPSRADWRVQTTKRMRRLGFCFAGNSAEASWTGNPSTTHRRSLLESRRTCSSSTLSLGWTDSGSDGASGVPPDGPEPAEMRRPWIGAFEWT